MKKRSKLITLSLSSLISVLSLGTLISTFNSNTISDFSKLNNKISNDNISDSVEKDIVNNEQTSVKPLVPLDYDSSIPLLVQETGPIISQKSIITSLDWFGAEKWHIDLEKAEWNGMTFLPKGISRQNWNKYFGSAMINYSLDKNNHRLWILSNSGNGANGIKVPKQRIMEVDSQNGEIIQIKDIAYQGNENRLYRKIQVLDSGNVMIYSHGEPNFDLYNASNKNITTISYNNELTKTMDSDISDMKSNANKTFSFLFSISSNVNIAVFTPEAWRGDVPNVNKSGNIYFAYVDDNLKILNNNSIDWKTAKYMDSRDGMTNETYEIVTSSGKLNKNYVGISGDSFPKLSYKLPDGRTLVTIYNKLYIFWPTSNNNEPIFKSFDLNVKDASGGYRPIESWTTDTGNNVYVKFAGDTKIQKISITGSTHSDTSIKLSSYYDISGSPVKEIRERAKDFIMYNVYGYSGQVMLLNPIRIERANVPDLSDETTANKFKDNLFGLAAAIVDSKQSAGQGDSKGLLNTEKAFTKSSTFDIKSGVLENKLPSEINRYDLDITDGGFLTINNTTDENGQLKYKQFEKEIMDDSTNSSDNIKITVNIDQIPWFVNNGVMPTNITPLKITKSFRTGHNINERVLWKDVDLDYDFKNTLPSKVELKDVQRFDPFSININSQQTTVAGQVFPQTSYAISERDDATGRIKIIATFKYLPLDVDSNLTNIKEQKFEKTYTIFKNDSKKEFNFIGEKDKNQEDIKTIPQLKNLSESNLLPSSFDSSDTSSILKFVNTDTSSGYPLSKMTFSVIPDDNNGTLTISGSLPSDYYPGGNVSTTFTKTYKGLNKISDYSFGIIKNQTSFNKKLYRPSEINEQLIYNHFVIYKGFNSSDLSLSLLPNDNDGSLTIRIHLDSSYPEIVATNSGFNKDNNGYIREEKIDGFKTTLEYKTQYEISFVNDNDISLDEIKKYTPKQIEQSLNPKNSINKNNNLTINGSQINSEKDLAIAVINSLGSNLPKKPDLSSSENFTYNIYYNDPNGEITIKLTFKNISGTNGDLVFIQRFTGFAKGNQITTDDVLSFKTQSKLMIDNTDFQNTLPSELASKLNDESNRVKEIKKYISYYSGTYITAIDSNTFRLEIIADDIYGYMTIKIIFDKTIVTNPDSLLSYTVTYNGFMTE